MAHVLVFAQLNEIHPIFSDHAYPENVPVELEIETAYGVVDVVSVELKLIHPYRSDHAHPCKIHEASSYVLYEIVAQEFVVTQFKLI